jgi:hypothetical protein
MHINRVDKINKSSYIDANRIILMSFTYYYICYEQADSLSIFIDKNMSGFRSNTFTIRQILPFSNICHHIVLKCVLFKNGSFSSHTHNADLLCPRCPTVVFNVIYSHSPIHGTATSGLHSTTSHAHSRHWMNITSEFLRL